LLHAKLTGSDSRKWKWDLVHYGFVFASLAPFAGRADCDDRAPAQLDHDGSVAAVKRMSPGETQGVAKMNDANVASARCPDRVHLVLVPGSVGFDALGQLEYYAGVTSLFQQWRKTIDVPAGREEPAEVPSSGRPVLHYFDNFPTAGVSTRASRLRQYLAKRIARGEFSSDDEVVVIGHSTGGLDIRRLVWDLATESAPETTVDGGRESGVRVPPSEILRLVKRVVFLSVPHWGTNIADWVRGRAVERWMVVTNLRAAVAGSQVPLLDTLEEWITGCAASVADLDILRAVRDVLAEADASTGTPGPLRTADAHEAASDVELWLRHIASDFSAIDDLASQPPHGDRASPAHFDPDARTREADFWRTLGIRSRSYATLGKRPCAFAGPDVPPWDFLQPTTYPDLIQNPVNRGTDLAYRACYRACAGGPFKPPVLTNTTLRYLDPAHEQLIRQWTDNQIMAWDNDGIVNTASMVWRDNEDAVLVPADHMDIVGHYALVDADGHDGRQHQAYDLLRSASEFTAKTFDQVWSDVFTWSLRGAGVPNAATPAFAPSPLARTRSGEGEHQAGSRDAHGAGDARVRLVLAGPDYPRDAAVSRGSARTACAFTPWSWGSSLADSAGAARQA
jgi:hypothetical protein